MGLLFGLVGLSIFAMLIFALAGMPGLPWKLGHLILAFLVIGPVVAVSAAGCLKRCGQITSPITPQEEGALMLLLTAMLLFLSCFTLYTPSDPRDMDSIRLFLAMAHLVCMMWAPLLLVPLWLRRITLSMLVVFHLGGIVSAALALNPSPWIVQQIFGRIYRPYLEFMYLGNAYRFYSPEPGPASYFWFRIFYEDEKGREFAEWYKIPEVKDNGWHGYPLSLIYQRMLATTENAIPTSEAPPKLETIREGDKFVTQPSRYYLERLRHSRNYEEMVQPIGKMQPPPQAPPDKIVPFHPQLNYDFQYYQPSLFARQLLESFSKHLASRPPPADRPNWKFKSVKIYRVTHIIPQAPLPNVTHPLAQEFNPQDPELYRPIYMGAFDMNGKGLDDYQSAKPDPFLYWMLPILRDEPFKSDSVIRDYARRHAGDPRWVRLPNGEWAEDSRLPPPKMPLNP